MAGVTRDRETGELVGFEEICALLDIEESYEHKTTALSVFHMTKEQYTVSEEFKNAEGKRQLNLQKDGSHIVITIEESGEDGQVSYAGLPEELQEFLFNYSNEELLQDPESVLQSIVRMQACFQKGVGAGVLLAMDVPTLNEENQPSIAQSFRRQMTVVDEELCAEAGI